MDFEAVRPVANLLSVIYRYYVSLGHPHTEALALSRLASEVLINAAHTARELKVGVVPAPAPEGPA